MDTGQFDHLVKSLGAASSRRALCTGLGASLVAILLGTEATTAKQNHHNGKGKHQSHHPQHLKQKSKKPPASRPGKACRQAGQPCSAKAADSCCAGLICGTSGRGASRRCSPCPQGAVVLNGSCCTPDNTTACAGKTCGDVTNNCHQTVHCGGPCSPPPSPPPPPPPPPPGGCPDGTIACGTDCFPACCPGT